MADESDDVLFMQEATPLVKGRPLGVSRNLALGSPAAPLEAGPQAPPLLAPQTAEKPLLRRRSSSSAREPLDAAMQVSEPETARTRRSSSRATDSESERPARGTRRSASAALDEDDEDTGTSRKRSRRGASLEATPQAVPLASAKGNRKQQQQQQPQEQKKDVEAASEALATDGEFALRQYVKEKSKRAYLVAINIPKASVPISVQRTARRLGGVIILYQCTGRPT